MWGVAFSSLGMRRERVVKSGDFPSLQKFQGIHCTWAFILGYTVATFCMWKWNLACWCKLQWKFVRTKVGVHLASGISIADQRVDVTFMLELWAPCRQEAFLCGLYQLLGIISVVVYLNPRSFIRNVTVSLQSMLAFRAWNGGHAASL